MSLTLLLRIGGRLRERWRPTVEKKLHHPLHHFNLIPNLIMKQPDSLSKIRIEATCWRTLNIWIKIKLLILGIKALEVRALIPLILFYTLVISMKWNDEEKVEATHWSSARDQARSSESSRIFFLFLLSSSSS